MYCISLRPLFGVAASDWLITFYSWSTNKRVARRSAAILIMSVAILVDKSVVWLSYNSKTQRSLYCMSTSSAGTKITDKCATAQTYVEILNRRINSRTPGEGRITHCTSSVRPSVRLSVVFVCHSHKQTLAVSSFHYATTANSYKINHLSQRSNVLGTTSSTIDCSGTKSAITHKLFVAPF